jgi:CheY-like chemotaxis protein
MSSNVIELARAARSRVLVAHQRADVRHALRTLIEDRNVTVVEAADGEAALDLLESSRFDLLVLELDLPINDGVTVMQLHRLLLAHERVRVDPPAVLFTLAPEVRSSATLTNHLLSLGVAGFIDDAPRREVANLVAAVLQARGAQNGVDKPAVA